MMVVVVLTFGSGNQAASFACPGATCHWHWSYNDAMDKSTCIRAQWSGQMGCALPCLAKAGSVHYYSVSKACTHARTALCAVVHADAAGATMAMYHFSNATSTADACIIVVEASRRFCRAA